MLTLDMVPELVLFEHLVALSALVLLLWAILEMELQISLLDPCPTLECAFNLKLTDYLI